MLGTQTRMNYMNVSMNALNVETLVGRIDPVNQLFRTARSNRNSNVQLFATLELNDGRTVRGTVIATICDLITLEGHVQFHKDEIKGGHITLLHKSV